MQEAGASAIELNVYYLQGDPLTPGRDVEARYLEILAHCGRGGEDPDRRQAGSLPQLAR